MNMSQSVVIVGAGLAGTDAAYYLAERGVKVYLYESKEIQKTPAQKTNYLAELVCTNSLKSTATTSAHGLLKLEMQSLGSLILSEAKKAAVPAGDALAVDRDQFAEAVTSKIKNHPNITYISQVVSNPEQLKEKHQASHVVISSGPLTLKPLEEWIVQSVSDDDLYFYDAIAPVVDADSLDYEELYFMDRHQKHEGPGDYLNIPLNEEQYYKFVNDVLKADKVPAQNFEKETFFESCLPIDVMASRGPDTLRFSCMKPIGLERKGEKRSYAVIQLRKENLLGSAFNMVGFQNRLTYKEQVRIFRTLPGFKKAGFLHLGSVHRNTYLNAAKILNPDLSMKAKPGIHFAGQIAGVEGYTESAAIGLYVASQIFRELEGKESVKWPKETAIGALIEYLMTSVKPVPSNVNFGLLPRIELNREQRKSKDRKKIKKQLVSDKAQEVFHEFMGSLQ